VLTQLNVLDLIYVALSRAANSGDLAIVDVIQDNDHKSGEVYFDTLDYQNPGGPERQTWRIRSADIAECPPEEDEEEAGEDDRPTDV